LKPNWFQGYSRSSDSIKFEKEKRKKRIMRDKNKQNKIHKIKKIQKKNHTLQAIQTA